MYRKIAAINDNNDVIDIEDELIDRYGDIPGPVRNLIKVAYIKALARSLGISAVTEKKDSVIFTFADSKRSISGRSRRQPKNTGGNCSSVLEPLRTSCIKTQVSGEKLADNIKILLQDLKSYDTG